MTTAANNSGKLKRGRGRPKGALTRKTRLIAEQAAAEGITPLEVMVRTMRLLWTKATEKADQLNVELARQAAEVAAIAAPYMHPRLASVEHFIDGEVRHAVVSDKVMDVDQWVLEHGSDRPALPAPKAGE